MATGKIKTLYSDKEKTEALFPRTKTNAISDENGIGLDALIEHLAYADTEAGEVTTIPLNADTLQGHPASDFATPTYVKDEINALTAEDVGAAASVHNHAAGDITSGALSLERGGTGRNFADVPPYAIIRATSNTTTYPYLYYQTTNDGAFYATSENGAPKFGTLPIKQGGTGATDGSTAISNLGGVHFQHKTINAGSSIKIESGGNILIICRLTTTSGTTGVYAISSYSLSRAPVIAQLASATNVTVSTGGSNDAGWYTTVSAGSTANVYVTVYGGCTIT